MRLRLETLGASYDDAARIRARKSIWMVLWLRERRDGDTLTAFYRRKHFAEKRKAKP